MVSARWRDSSISCSSNPFCTAKFSSLSSISVMCLVITWDLCNWSSSRGFFSTNACNHSSTLGLSWYFTSKSQTKSVMVRRVSSTSSSDDMILTSRFNLERRTSSSLIWPLAVTPFLMLSLKLSINTESEITSNCSGTESRLGLKINHLVSGAPQ